jgi:hypothetical protein
MFFVVFHQDTRRIFFGTRGKKSPFGHAFGGAADYSGLAYSEDQPPVHLLFRLNMDDPAVGVRVPGVQWLPLLCAIRYGACDLGYRVLSNDAVKILHHKETKPWDDFPYEGYPEKLPAKPLLLQPGDHDPDRPKDAYVLAGAFGSEILTPGQFARLTHFIVENELYQDPDMIGGWWESPEQYLRDPEAFSWPFVQGRPDQNCPDQTCPNHGQRGALRTIAVFEEDKSEARRLWGPHCENLQIIHQICPQCAAIRVSNQCT